MLRREPDQLRIPDVSFVSWNEVPDDGIPEGFWEGPPTLAVEIISPTIVRSTSMTRYAPIWPPAPGSLGCCGHNRHRSRSTTLMASASSVRTMTSTAAMCCPVSVPGSAISSRCAVAGNRASVHVRCRTESSPVSVGAVIGEYRFLAVGQRTGAIRRRAPTNLHSAVGADPGTCSPLAWYVGCPPTPQGDRMLYYGCTLVYKDVHARRLWRRCSWQSGQS